eukprot:tig00000737_g3812.t1
MPAAEDLEVFARSLGIHPVTDAPFLWIAEAAYCAPLPSLSFAGFEMSEWSQQEDAEGFEYFFNALTGQSQRDHPMDSYYKSLFQVQKGVWKEQETELRLQEEEERRAHLTALRERARAERRAAGGAPAPALEALREEEAGVASTGSGLTGPRVPGHLVGSFVVKGAPVGPPVPLPRQASGSQRSEPARPRVRRQSLAFDGFTRPLAMDARSAALAAAQGLLEHRALRVLAAAEAIGLDADPAGRDAHLFWLAKRAAQELCRVPPGWELRIDKQGEGAIFAHPASGKTSEANPAVRQYRRLVEQERAADDGALLWGRFLRAAQETFVHVVFAGRRVVELWFDFADADGEVYYHDLVNNVDVRDDPRFCFEERAAAAVQRLFRGHLARRRAARLAAEREARRWAARQAREAAEAAAAAVEAAAAALQEEELRRAEACEAAVALAAAGVAAAAADAAAEAHRGREDGIRSLSAALEAERAAREAHAAEALRAAAWPEARPLRRGDRVRVSVVRARGLPARQPDGPLNPLALGESAARLATREPVWDYAAEEEHEVGEEPEAEAVAVEVWGHSRFLGPFYVGEARVPLGPWARAPWEGWRPLESSRPELADPVLDVRGAEVLVRIDPLPARQRRPSEEAGAAAARAAEVGRAEAEEAATAASASDLGEPLRPGERLRVRVVGAKGLAARAPGGVANAYAVVYAGAGLEEGRPWDFVAAEWACSEEPAKAALAVEVWSATRWEEPFYLGEARMPLGPPLRLPWQGWLRLATTRPGAASEADVAGARVRAAASAAAQAALRPAGVRPGDTVRVAVVAGRSLVAKQSDGKSHPYVMVYAGRNVAPIGEKPIRENEGAVALGESKPKYTTLDPEWGYEEAEAYVAQAPAEEVLVVEVWCWARFLAPKYMGEVRVRLDELGSGAALEGWFPMETSRPLATKPEELAGSALHLRFTIEPAEGAAQPEPAAGAAGAETAATAAESLPAEGAADAGAAPAMAEMEHVAGASASAAAQAALRPAGVRPGDTVRVAVVAGRSLVAKQSDGKSHPYVMVYAGRNMAPISEKPIRENEGAVALGESKPKYTTLDPEWGYEEAEAYVAQAPAEEVLVVEVWCWARFLAPKYMGEVRVRLDELGSGAALEGWFPMETSRPLATKPEELAGSALHLRFTIEPAEGAAQPEPAAGAAGAEACESEGEGERRPSFTVSRAASLVVDIAMDDAAALSLLPIAEWRAMTPPETAARAAAASALRSLLPPPASSSASSPSPSRPASLIVGEAMREAAGAAASSASPSPSRPASLLVNEAMREAAGLASPSPSRPASLVVGEALLEAAEADAEAAAAAALRASAALRLQSLWRSLGARRRLRAHRAAILFLAAARIQVRPRPAPAPPRPLIPPREGGVAVRAGAGDGAGRGAGRAGVGVLLGAHDAPRGPPPRPAPRPRRPRLQCAARARLARRQLLRLRAEAERTIAAARAERLAARAAALVVQCAWRAFAARLPLLARRARPLRDRQRAHAAQRAAAFAAAGPEQHAAAAAIQACARSLFARRLRARLQQRQQVAVRRKKAAPPPVATSPARGGGAGRGGPRRRAPCWWSSRTGPSGCPAPPLRRHRPAEWARVVYPSAAPGALSPGRRTASRPAAGLLPAGPLAHPVPLALPPLRRAARSLPTSTPLPERPAPPPRPPPRPWRRLAAGPAPPERRGGGGGERGRAGRAVAGGRAHGFAPGLPCACFHEECAHGGPEGARRVSAALPAPAPPGPGKPRTGPASLAPPGGLRATRSAGALEAADRPASRGSGGRAARAALEARGAVVVAWDGRGAGPDPTAAEAGLEGPPRPRSSAGLEAGASAAASGSAFEAMHAHAPPAEEERAPLAPPAPQELGEEEEAELAGLADPPGGRSPFEAMHLPGGGSGSGSGSARGDESTAGAPGLSGSGASYAPLGFPPAKPKLKPKRKKGPGAAAAVPVARAALIRVPAGAVGMQTVLYELRPDGTLDATMKELRRPF